MEIQTYEEFNFSISYGDTGYSWTREQLDNYEESWSRNHENEDNEII